MINFSLLAASIEQSGPWKSKGIKADKNWCLENLKKRIDEINWNDAKKDIKRFIKPHELPSIELWSAEYFNDVLNKIRQYM